MQNRAVRASLESAQGILEELLEGDVPEDDVGNHLLALEGDVRGARLLWHQDEDDDVEDLAQRGEAP